MESNSHNKAIKQGHFGFLSALGWLRQFTPKLQSSQNAPYVRRYMERVLRRIIVVFSIVFLVSCAGETFPNYKRWKSLIEFNESNLNKLNDRLEKDGQKSDYWFRSEMEFTLKDPTEDFINGQSEKYLKYLPDELRYLKNDNGLFIEHNYEGGPYECNNKLCFITAVLPSNEMDIEECTEASIKKHGTHCKYPLHNEWLILYRVLSKYEETI